MSEESFDTRLIWSNPGVRADALATLADAVIANLEGDCPTNEGDLRKIVIRIDNAVEEKMRSLNFPRGPIRDVCVHNLKDGAHGGKHPGCLLEISAELILRKVYIDERADQIFLTWIHESVHARGEYSLESVRKYWQSPGYEDGLAEGVALWIARDVAGLDVVEEGYRLYVRAYCSLARVMGIPVERLWRAFWPCPPGRIHESFSDVVDDVWYNERGRRLNADELRELRRRADSLFRAANQFDLENASYSDTALDSIWRRAAPSFTARR